MTLIPSKLLEGGGSIYQEGTGADSVIPIQGGHDAEADSSLITGGTGNYIDPSGEGSFIAAGVSNVVAAANCFVLGSGITAESDNTTYVENLQSAGKASLANGTNAVLNIPVLSSDPGSPATGDIWAVTNGPAISLKIHNSGTTYSVDLTAGGG